MTLGMIWTIILRFAIQDISVEGKNEINVYIYMHCFISYRNVCQGRFIIMVST
jgi:hypothetical protein